MITTNEMMINSADTPLGNKLSSLSNNSYIIYWLRSVSDHAWCYSLHNLSHHSFSSLPSSNVWVIHKLSRRFFGRVFHRLFYRFSGYIFHQIFHRLTICSSTCSSNLAPIPSSPVCIFVDEEWSPHARRGLGPPNPRPDWVDPISTRIPLSPFDHFSHISIFPFY